MVAPSVPLSSGVLNRSSQSHLLREDRPAWARPQTPWPFRVIDPQQHRPGQPAKAAQSWTS